LSLKAFLSRLQTRAAIQHSLHSHSLAHEEVDWQDIGRDFVIDGARIGLAGLRMRDRDLARRWRHYHHTLAAIRLTRAEVNQSLSSASRVRAGDRQLNLAPYLVEPEPPEEPDDDERECGCTCDFPCSVEQPNACACGRCSIASLDF